MLDHRGLFVARMHMTTGKKADKGMWVAVAIAGGLIVANLGFLGIPGVPVSVACDLLGMACLEGMPDDAFWPPGFHVGLTWPPGIPICYGLAGSATIPDAFRSSRLLYRMSLFLVSLYAAVVVLATALHLVPGANVNTPPAKAVGFGLRLKAGSVGHSADCCRYTT